LNVSVIIVNYNTTDHLQKCLKAIFNFTTLINFEVIVVDNNSPDRCIENLPNEFPKVRFFFRDVNDGFGAACNFGVKNAKGKYFLFANPDIIIEQNSLKEIFNYMENNSNVALSSGILFGDNGENVHTFNYFPDLGWEFMEASGKGTGKRIKQLLSNEKVVSKSSVALEVDWTMGAFMFVRAEVFKRINGFDEIFFLYYEDVDLQKRIINLGYKIVVLPSVRIFHFERGSVRSFEGENIYFFHMHRSRIIYFYKHSNFFYRNTVRAMHIAGYFFRLITLPFRKKFKGKEKQKLYQYILILKIYFSSKEKIIHLTYLK